MTLHTVEFVEIDTDPVISFYDQQFASPEYRDLPDRFAAALRDVMDNPEDRKCANCEGGVGYVLVETDRGEQVRWRWVTLIDRPPTYYPEAKGEPGGPVVLLCEDCSVPLFVKDLI